MDTLQKGNLKRCDICRRESSIETEIFGPWMHKGNVTVHYYCLLLSTNLPQEGEDGGGINGFFLRHIRAEIAAAGKRRCEYCDEVGASIQCHNCKSYFDLICGIRNRCLFHFVDDFKSICSECVVLDEFQKKAQLNWNAQKMFCYICKDPLGYQYSPIEHLYAPCCNNGFVHRICMQKYAMSSGYYMRCIWCRDMNLRQKIRLQGVFVPDREARWETKERFRDLHRGHNRCDMENCKCPRGREYKSTLWNLINCCLCGSFGVHYPRCIPSSKGVLPLPENFKCEICSCPERNMQKDSPTGNVREYFDLYVCKTSGRTEKQVLGASSMSQSEVFNFDCNSLFSQAQDNVVTSTTPNVENTISPNISSTQDFTNHSTEQTHATESMSIGQECNHLAELEFIDFSEDFQLIGTCKIRFDKNSPRFVNKTLQDILSDPDILQQSDIVEQTGDIAPFLKAEFSLTGIAGEKFLAQHCPNLSTDDS